MSTKEKPSSLTKIKERLSDKNLSEKEKAVSEIIENVKALGDKALASYSQKFDNINYDLNKDDPFKIEAKGNFDKLDKKLQSSLKLAKSRIEKFHQEEFSRIKDWSFKGDLNEELGVKYQSIDSVAVYIPGGQAPLISTVLMTAIPAQVAGVRRIVLLSPPEINPGILAAADLLGIDEVYAIGGAQAIAALAYGTESIEPVDKIVGPGNIYVSLAKKQVFGQVGIDGIYGPSELAIIADDGASPKQIAADLLSQLEHGSGLESVLLASPNKEIIEESKKELDAQIEALAKHKNAELIKTIKNSLENWSALIEVKDLDEAAEIINDYAPEHLELQTKENKDLIKKIKNAGAIFIGSNSCESLGDYLAGPSHCLPTAGSARFSSGLQVIDFMKKSSIIDFSNSDVSEIIEDVANIARAEDLEAHAKAMEYRNGNSK